MDFEERRVLLRQAVESSRALPIPTLKQPLPTLKQASYLSHQSSYNSTSNPDFIQNLVTSITSNERDLSGLSQLLTSVLGAKAGASPGFSSTQASFQGGQLGGSVMAPSEDDPIEASDLPGRTCMNSCVDGGKVLLAEACRRAGGDYDRCYNRGLWGVIIGCALACLIVPLAGGINTTDDSLDLLGREELF